MHSKEICTPRNTFGERKLKTFENRAALSTDENSKL